MCPKYYFHRFVHHYILNNPLSTVIQVNNLSKQYRLGMVGTGSLAHDINRAWHRIIGNEDPYIKIGQATHQNIGHDNPYSWALKEVSFNIKQGEVLGIIGNNGAGKSTLLKILSRITSPTSGSVKIKGTVASLLEVGTGFHPELSGRDNIFLNGAILGMGKSEIKARLEEIVDFSEVGPYIDTPVKRYSSGMYMRLAFAVAAHLNSDILIVDEVLAVGDASFQKKCMRKMSDVSNQQGKTILFVSHNLSSMQKLCTYGIWLNRGRLEYSNTINAVIEHYVMNDKKQARHQFEEQPELDAFLLEAEIRDSNDQPISSIPIGRKWKIALKYKVHKPISNFVSAIGIVSMYDVSIKTAWQKPLDVSQGIYEAIFEEHLIDYAMGQYKISIGLSHEKKVIQYSEHILSLTISSAIDSLDESVLVTENQTGFILNPMRMGTKRVTPIRF